MSQNRRERMEKKKSEFLKAFEEEADQVTQSLELHHSLSDQDHRLTTKHIKTLTFLQDIVNENKTLKARNQELEDELSSCTELHQSAREAPQKLKDMQQQYLEKMDEINQLLLQKHQTELTRVVNEKMELEKSWQTEKKQLQNENNRLKVSLNEVSGNLSAARENSDRAQMMQLKLDALDEENAILKEEQQRYLAENDNLRAEIQSLLHVRHQNETLKNDLKSSNQTQMELQLKHDKLVKEMEESSSNDQKPFIMEQAKHKLTKLTQERRILTERCHQFEQENEKLCRLLQEYSQQIEHLGMFKDKLLAEINLLKEELTKKKNRPSGEKDFREFVNMKRELVALKEENEELSVRMRSRVRAHSLLPALKGPEPKLYADRRLSASSTSTTGKKL